ADRRGIAWAATLLSDPDPEIQNMAAGLVDQLLWGDGLDPTEAEPHLRQMESHSNAYVRRQAERIRDFLAKRIVSEG
ncbi:MAG TPA: hypothetical protein VGE52_20850, partial [Pirellulales bacterium]